MRTCPRCKERLPRTPEWFPRSAGKADGLHSWCKACWSEYTAERRAKR